jgi:5,10-methylenetetrahydrofolate reductase
MTFKKHHLFLPLLFCCVTLSDAQETPEQIVKRLADLGPGVHEVKAENGRLKSLKVVGQDRISTVLGAAKGLQTAQKRATLKANAAFIEWMKSNVASVSATGDETIVTLQGDGENVTKQGKSVETTKEGIAQAASGFVRGLTLVAKDQNADTLTLVYSWSPEKANLAKAAQKDNESDQPYAGTPAAPVDKAVPSKTVVSPDFDE